MLLLCPQIKPPSMSNLQLEELLTQYRDRRPTIVFEWHDDETDAEGWVVINSLRGGAAGGGTRMRKGLTKDEVVALAKVMEIKFSVAGPNIGGAKSGINFDPSDPRREEVLTRWYKAVLPLLKSYYGTGGDLNVDEMRDVIPITEDLGLWHPQEGIVNGHIHASEGKKVNLIGQLRYGCSKMVEDSSLLPEGGKKQSVADLITGYGVAESVKHYYHIYRGITPVGKTAIIQGWGNVASAAACYLAQQGVKIIGIIDRKGGFLRPEGMELEEVKSLFNNKMGNQLGDYPSMLSFNKVDKDIWDMGADIFIPGAASRLINREQSERMIASGLEVIACGANVPFVDDAVFFGPTAHFVDEKVALIPDFIANCGMARVFAYLMQPDIEVSDVAIFSDVSLTIKRALEQVHQLNSTPNGLTSNAMSISLKKLML
jgi:glutamate dehydrogenase/leucine dehydrogenase